MPRTHRPAAQRREEILNAAHTLFKEAEAEGSLEPRSLRLQ